MKGFWRLFVASSASEDLWSDRSVGDWRLCRHKRGGRAICIITFKLSCRFAGKICHGVVFVKCGPRIGDMIPVVAVSCNSMTYFTRTPHVPVSFRFVHVHRASEWR